MTKKMRFVKSGMKIIVKIPFQKKERAVATTNTVRDSIPPRPVWRRRRNASEQDEVEAGQQKTKRENAEHDPGEDVTVHTLAARRRTLARELVETAGMHITLQVLFRMLPPLQGGGKLRLGHRVPPFNRFRG